MNERLNNSNKRSLTTAGFNENFGTIPVNIGQNQNIYNFHQHHPQHPSLPPPPPPPPLQQPQFGFEQRNFTMDSGNVSLPNNTYQRANDFIKQSSNQDSDRYVQQLYSNLFKKAVRKRPSPPEYVLSNQNIDFGNLHMVEKEFINLFPAGTNDRSFNFKGNIDFHTSNIDQFRLDPRAPNSPQNDLIFSNPIELPNFDFDFRTCNNKKYDLGGFASSIFDKSFLSDIDNYISGQLDFSDLYNTINKAGLTSPIKLLSDNLIQFNNNNNFNQNYIPSNREFTQLNKSNIPMLYNQDSSLSSLGQNMQPTDAIIPETCLQSNGNSNIVDPRVFDLPLPTTILENFGSQYLPQNFPCWNESTMGNPNALFLDVPSRDMNKVNNNNNKKTKRPVVRKQREPRKGRAKKRKAEFKCNFENCIKVFSRKDDLNRHIRSHTGEKPFRCEVCKRCFARSDHLSTHKRTHTDDRPYPCSFCKKSFKRSDERNRHYLTHDKNNNWNNGASRKSLKKSLKANK